MTEDITSDTQKDNVKWRTHEDNNNSEIDVFMKEYLQQLLKTKKCECLYERRGNKKLRYDF